MNMYMHVLAKILKSQQNWEQHRERVLNPFKVSSIVILCGKLSSVLTFEKFYLSCDTHPSPSKNSKTPACYSIHYRKTLLNWNYRISTCRAIPIARKKFSKISSLLNSPYEITVELTVEYAAYWVEIACLEEKACLEIPKDQLAMGWLRLVGSLKL